MNDFINSRKLLERAKHVIPSMSQTFSKGPNQWAGNVSPHYLTKGEGAWVWDVDGNRYLDYLMALGPIILGYNNQRVNEAAKKQIDEGVIFSQMHPLEVEVSEMLCDLIPCAEMVRFAKNGSDVTSGAIRAARAFTSRERVAVCGYHGWQDWYIATTTRDKGIPKAVKELSHTFPYNDLESLSSLLDSHKGEFAAVIMEPVGVEPPIEGYLEGVKELCEAHGTLLIFDEIITGFRMSLGGAQEYFGVTPDLACFGKAMANGFPLSAVVGRRDIMEIFDEIFFSGTFGGEAVSLAACKATIEEIQTANVIEHNWQVGNKLLSGLRDIINRCGLSEVVKVLGYDVRSILAIPHDDEYQARLRRSFLMQECVKRGLLYFGSNNITASHNDEEVDFTLKVFEEVLPLVAIAHQSDDFEERLDGPCIEAIFRKA
ncbi:MAG: aminotransferase class III-fold pyridoxal phosphate-dependent enzyme [Rhodospirillales bacterium]|nr:aminotransferase class III-fold pyridoxal phosphate-dependent enzyme [Rhodospirillales bacterium]